MNASKRWLLATTLCALGLTLGALPAHAKSKSKSRGVKLVKSPAVTYANGQTESQRQTSEDRRLRRECKGRPNAGACAGYTR
jgi:hypothetical protein